MDKRQMVDLDELRQLDAAGEDAWLRENLTATAAALIRKRMRSLDCCLADCLAITIVENSELAKRLIGERLERERDCE